MEKYTLSKGFDSIEETMIRNIANSIFQIEFHDTASAEDLQTYYGWKEPFEEGERRELVEDVRKRLVSEQLILATYQKMKLTLNEKYGEKNPTGDLDLPAQRPDGGSGEQGSVSADAEEDGSADGDHTEGRHDDDAAANSDSGEQAEGDGGGSSDRQS